MKTKRVLKKNAIKAYKAVNSDLTCKGFRYEVGKEYHHKGKLELCEAGFHACPKLTDCFNFYPFDKTETRVAEVLVWGKVEYEDIGDKLCASNIKVVRELTWTEVLSLCNSGYHNSGHSNSGNWNSGYGNSGDWNSGNGNSGDYNTGYRNSGDWNSGDCNTGSWNSGNSNSGIFNTDACEYTFAFNQLAKKKDLEDIPVIPFLFFDLVKWIPKEHMSSIEKSQHPEYATTGGYLKKYTYKEAFRKSFEAAKKKANWPEQLEKLKALPNFDFKIFEEISGITAEELTGKKLKRKRKHSTKGA